MEEDVVVGRPPTTEERYWLQAAKTVTPDKMDESVQRLDAHGKFLFSTISVVGTFLAAFGVFSPIGAVILRTKWLLLPSAMICGSLALAMMGLTPILRKVCPYEPTSIASYYNHVIRYRASFITLASILFAVGLLSIAGVTAVALSPLPLSPTISARLSGAGDKTALKSKIEFENVPPKSVVESEIFGTGETGTQILLFKDLSTADLSGKVVILADLDRVQDFVKFQIGTEIISSGKIIYRRQVEIRRQKR
jgi:hypothetical protein